MLSHRIDRLLQLIIVDFFDYFKRAQPTYLDTQAVVAIDKNYINITRRAYLIWEEGMVFFQGDGTFTVHMEKM